MLGDNDGMDGLSASHVVRALLRTRRTLLADVEVTAGSPERLLMRTDVSGTFQLSELISGVLIELTDLPEPVATAEYVPGAREAVLAVDTGGDERHQLYVLDLEEAARATVSDFDRMRALTDDPRFVHVSAGVSPDGRSLAYLSNRANGVDFDLWLCDLAGGEHRLLYGDGSYLQPGSGFSPDGDLISVLRPGARPLDEDLLLIDVRTGNASSPLSHPDEPALVGAPAWVGPASFYASSNVGRDFAAIAHHDLATRTTTTLAGTGKAFDTEVVSASDGTVLLIENRGGASVMATVEPETGNRGADIELTEPGVTHTWFFRPPKLSADGSRLFYTLTTPRHAGDVYSCELATGLTNRLTHTRTEVDPEELVTPELGELTSFDGERVPVFIYRPTAGPGRPAVVVVVHGGPEGQAQRLFDPEIQALATAGYGVVVPNVRGSTGYGKRYAALDDTTKRLDSVQDLAAIHGQLDDLGFDAGRAALWGGSYGGYMVLAGLAFQPQLWAAGVDIVGISNLVTFLENTSDYRRALRELEYGSLTADREFLTKASPLTQVDAIRAPLFVIHGRNDPRVPVGEAEQLIDRLKARNVPCELVIYEDEGHGLARLANQLDAYPRAISFLDEALAQRR